MEYVLMTLFIVIIISALIFFLMSWQFTQLRVTESKTESEKALFLMKFFIKSPFFTKDESLFDDAKLQAFAGMGNDACEELNIIFGRDWFARVYYIDETESWLFCGQDRKNYTYVLPVNIYRNSDNTNHLGVLEVGVYHEISE